MPDADTSAETEASAITPEQRTADFKEFQKLVKYAERKKFWQEHPSIHGIVSEINFHA